MGLSESLRVKPWFAELAEILSEQKELPQIPNQIHISPIFAISAFPNRLVESQSR